MPEQDYYSLETRIDKMVDELQGLCSQNGLSNTASEEVVVTSVFLYKFLNDKFISNLRKFAEEIGEAEEEVLANENDELDAFYDAYPQDVVLKSEDTIEHLINETQKDDFHKRFDDALERISSYPENDKFKVETAEGNRIPLFTRITENLIDAGKRLAFARNIFSIITQDKFDFTGAYASNFDFYSTIFEYLIKNYNVASGTYAEYFTPQAISSIIATILVGMSTIDDTRLYEICDPAAGSGSLVLHLANALGKGNFGNRARVYMQDISAKSTRFLRLNLMLNGLTESLDNIVQGDSLTDPAQYNVNHDPSSGHKSFDFLTINPPFKMDFSSTRDRIDHDWEQTDRFFAGVPKIPANKKDSMAIYLCFMQHVLWSLKPDGKAAIVCPTGFLTAKSGIEYAIRQRIVDNNWLQGVVSMPSNIFANTGTNVSVIFIDKSKTDDEIILIDASKLGEKRKEGKNQRTVLRDNEIKQIEDTFINRTVTDDFSVLVIKEQLQDKNYSFSAGQYFEVKIEYVDITAEEFEAKMNEYKTSLAEKFQRGHELEQSIMEQLGGLKYDD